MYYIILNILLSKLLITLLYISIYLYPPLSYIAGQTLLSFIACIKSLSSLIPFGNTVAYLPTFSIT